MTNHNYYLPSALWNIASLDKTHLTFCSHLIGFASQGRQFFKSVQTLAQELCRSENTVRKAMQHVVDLGIAVLVKERKGQSSIYDLSDEWKEKLGIAKAEDTPLKSCGGTPSNVEGEVNNINIKTNITTTTRESRIKKLVKTAKQKIQSKPPVEPVVYELDELEVIPEAAVQIVEEENRKSHRTKIPIDTLDVLLKFIAWNKDNYPRMDHDFFCSMFRGFVKRERAPLPEWLMKSYKAWKPRKQKDFQMVKQSKLADFEEMEQEHIDEVHFEQALSAY